MWVVSETDPDCPCLSVYTASNSSHLSVYTDYGVDIFDIHTTEWVQTISLRKVSRCVTMRRRPITEEDGLSLWSSRFSSDPTFER